MSAGLLFGAGAIVSFITLWGVVMAGGLFATRHQPPDDVVVVESEQPPIPLVAPVVAPVIAEPEWVAAPAPLLVAEA